MNLTNTFYKNIEAKTRYIINQGGTWSSKTYSIIQLLIMKAQKYDNLLISVVSESVPHLKRGALKDFQEIMINAGQFDYNAWNKTDSVYLFANGSKIEFFSADNPAKVHGGRRDILYFNEIQNNAYEIFYQLAMRTKQTIYCDYNPTSTFWIHERYLDNPEYSDQITYIHSTYKDNPYIPEAVVKDILTRAESDENFRKVYLEGIPGSLEGLIFTNYELVDEMPEEYKWKCYGMDFGYSNDPTTLLDIRYSQGALWIDELIYEAGLVNTPNPQNMKNIVDLLRQYEVPKTTEIIADSAEMKSISEIGSYGFWIIPAVKGQDSVNSTIDLIKRYPLKITKRSQNTIKEVRNYRWKVDKNGNALNVPIDNFNHSLDPLRYVGFYKLGMQVNTLTFGKR